jgi:hypothetical protein
MLRGLTPVPAVYKGFPLHPDDDNDPYATIRVRVADIGRRGQRRKRSPVQYADGPHPDHTPAPAGSTPPRSPTASPDTTA